MHLSVCTPTQCRFVRVWANPDCGLETRGHPETVAALQNLVEATHRVRDRAAVRA